MRGVPRLWPVLQVSNLQQHRDCDILKTMSPEPFALERYFARHEFTARWLLGSSDPESMTSAELLDLERGSRERFEKLWLGYTEAPGAPELRELMAARTGRLQSSDVLVFSGAEEPIFAFMHVALHRGDSIIVQMPGYQSHWSIAASLGVSVIPWYGNPARGWAPDSEELQELIQPSTKAILVCAPGNPSGWLPSGKEWENLIRIARSKDLWLFSDEVYRGLEMDPSCRLAPACSLYEKALSLDCLSKSCGLAGLRIGWLATQDRDLLERIAAFKDYLTICNSAPSEFLAAIALRNMESLQSRARLVIARNMKIFSAFMDRNPEHFRWVPNNAGSVCFPEFLAGDEMAFCDRLVAETGVMLVPGRFLGSRSPAIRFGLGRKAMPEALGLLESWIHENPPALGPMNP